MDVHDRVTASMPPLVSSSSSVARGNTTSTRKRGRDTARGDADSGDSRSGAECTADVQHRLDTLDLSPGHNKAEEAEQMSKACTHALAQKELQSTHYAVEGRETEAHSIIRNENDDDEDGEHHRHGQRRMTSIDHTLSYDSGNHRAHTPAPVVVAHAMVSELPDERRATLEEEEATAAGKTCASEEHIHNSDSNYHPGILTNTNTTSSSNHNNNYNNVLLTPSTAATSCSSLTATKHTRSSVSNSTNHPLNQHVHSNNNHNNKLFDALTARSSSPRASFSARTPSQHKAALRTRNVDIDVDAECDKDDDEGEVEEDKKTLDKVGISHSDRRVLLLLPSDSNDMPSPHKAHSTATSASTVVTTPPPASSLPLRLRSCSAGEQRPSQRPLSLVSENHRSGSSRTTSDSEHTSTDATDEPHASAAMSMHPVSQTHHHHNNNIINNNNYPMSSAGVCATTNTNESNNISTAAGDGNGAAEQLSLFSHGSGLCNYNSNSNSNSDSHNNSNTINNSMNSSSANYPNGGYAPRIGAGESNRRYTQPTLADYGLVADSALLRKALLDRESQIDELGTRVSLLEAELHRRESQLAIFESQREELHHKLDRFRQAMRTEMLLSARQGRTDARRVLHQKHFELGQIAILPHNGREVWVEGNVFRELLQRLQEVHRRRDEVEQLKKNAHMTVRQLQRIDKEREDSSSGSATVSTTAIGTTAAAAAAGSSSSMSAAPTDGADALYEAQEELQLRTAEYNALTNMAAHIKERQVALEQEKKAFLKEIRRLSDEDASEYLAVPTIGEEERYVLMNLLGKGGFSEVWRAFDLHEGRYVACKIHRVNRDWPAPTRAHYMRHAERELAIMRALHHPHLTKLYDVFRLGEAAFVSVMEFSPGMDLDTYLKRYHVLRECDARLILLQVVGALRHLATLEEPIIHYDLKPANILLHSTDPSVLEIKITDFGLSKIVRASAEGPSDNPTIELTSQGTGTYWYLPPECFDTTATPRINSKVDIWSVGVIFYQMVYGRRPFAEGESQRRIWQEKLIISSAKALRFPESPRVSEEAREVMRGCLTASVAERWDVHQLSQHPYLLRVGRRSGRARGTTAAAAAAGMSAAAIGTAGMAVGYGSHHHHAGKTVSPTTAHVAGLGATTLSDGAAPPSPHRRGIASYSF